MKYIKAGLNSFVISIDVALRTDDTRKVDYENYACARIMAWATIALKQANLINSLITKLL